MRPIIKALCVTLLLLNGSIILHAQEIQAEDYKTYQKIYNLVLDGAWSEAEEAFEIFIQEAPKSSWRDDAEFWHCYTLEKQNRLPEAAACYEKFLKQNKGSKWYNNAQTNLVKIASQLPQKERSKYGGLLQSLKQDANEEIALTALYALQNTDDERVRDQALNLLKQAENANVRAGALQILFRFDYTDEIIQTLKKVAWEDPVFHVRSNAMTVLIQKTYQNPSDSITAFETITQIAKEEPSPRIRTEALYHLVRQNATNATALVTDMVFNDKDMQRSALTAIPRLPSKNALDLLIKVTQTHPDVQMQKEACKHLAQIDLQKGLVFAQNIAQTHNDQDMHLFVIDILTRLPDGKGIPQLIEIAQSHAMKQVRQRAIQNLGYHNKDPQARQALLDLTEIK